ncbi:hypothetical protein OH77DRAFT_1425267 [Trametes cingulata]|nr:hypothetical protein OH77DRAFT_1425267 [Trametes cingulata]
MHHRRICSHRDPPLRGPQDSMSSPSSPSRPLAAPRAGGACKASEPVEHGASRTPLVRTPATSPAEWQAHRGEHGMSRSRCCCGPLRSLAWLAPRDNIPSCTLHPQAEIMDF